MAMFKRAPIAVRREERAAHIFMLPWFLGVIFITLGPMIISIFLSLTKYRLIGDPKFVGLDNYAKMLTDTRLLQSLKVTFIYVIVGVPLALMLALAIAVLLNKGVSGLSFYRSVYYLPSLFAGSVAIGVLWRQVFGAEGIINTVFGWFGIDTMGHSWVGDPNSALWTLILLHVWTFGSSMIIFLAGLRQIPQELYEASSLDGCGKWKQFLHVTVPMLTPIIFFNLVMGIINSFQNFAQAFVVSGGSGGPVDSTLVYALYLYQQAFGSARNMGYAAALGWLLVLIVGLLTLLNFALSKKWVHYED
ncbi:carbohydrate ABC transporter permease [Bifidobacterium oedipodis]|uniref:ABC transporter permease n=1 Tax=Bifidobacterium oedipodis TaxID=2675322 RepID=A0A7Y0ERI3_9BIFI|nr:sugar ABC transporter permease [Bifidobacterium sp. DSM 109957]NMM95108.1 ABC transporter permease [Bifidobacterium sp. DSM 109957]